MKGSILFRVLLALLISFYVVDNSDLCYAADIWAKDALLLKDNIAEPITICNNVKSLFRFALSWSEWQSTRGHGWYEIKPGECRNPYIATHELHDIVITPDPKLEEIFQLEDTWKSWNPGVEFDQASVCVSLLNSSYNVNMNGNYFDDHSKMCRPHEGKRFGKSIGLAVNTAVPGGRGTAHETEPLIINIGDPAKIPKIATGVINERCLYSFDDSIGVEKVETIIRWDYQAIKTTMHKLHHCMKLTVIGPIDIEGIAKSVVDSCVDKAIKEHKNEDIIEGLVALGGDIYGGNGTLTSLKLIEFAKGVTDRTIACLTDEGKVEEIIQNRLNGMINASVHGESNWIYWQL